MGLKVVDAEGKVDETTFVYEKLSVDGDVSLQDFVAQANADNIPMAFVEVKRGRVKEGEEQPEKGFLNYLLDALNLARYREAVAANKPAESPQDKAIKALVKLLGISVEEATKRVTG